MHICLHMPNLHVCSASCQGVGFLETPSWVMGRSFLLLTTACIQCGFHAHCPSHFLFLIELFGKEALRGI